jgi:hypothetical protein
MFNSGILDVVIGVVVLYLELSLVCTAVNELIAMVLKKRAKELEKGLLGLLTKRELVDKFYEHPLIKGLRPDQRKPSYIPSRTFSLALMDIVRHHSFDGTVSAATQAVAEKTAALGAATSAVAEATTALNSAASVNQAATEALEAAGAADKLQAAKDAQLAATNKAAAQAASTAATTKLEAAESALTAAQAYLAQVTRDAATAKQAEIDAQTAETAAKANPKDRALAAAATAARGRADAAADAIAPSASSLLTEARDKVAGVQSEVVPPQLKTALLALMDNAGTNLNKAQANIEQWFDDGMDRVSGVYKRKSHRLVVCIAIFVTILANVDTLQVADSLSHDKALRETIVAAAPELAKGDVREKAVASASPVATPVPSPVTPPVDAEVPKAAATPLTVPSPTPSLATIKASLDELKKYGLPIGYIRVCTPTQEEQQDSCSAAIEAQVRDTLAQLAQADDNLKKAEAKLLEANIALKAAEDNERKAESANQQATDENKPTAQTALSKARTDREKAKTELEQDQKARDDAAGKQTAARDARNEALAREAKITLVRAKLKKAEDDSKNNRDDEATQKALDAARLEAEALTACPQCRKESELTAAELRQRLPTTRGHRLTSGAGMSALVKDSLELLYSHWLGWALTAFAVSLGAPFWFDMLNKLIVVRSTVKPHEKSKEQESKDNSDEKDGTNKT